MPSRSSQTKATKLNGSVAIFKRKVKVRNLLNDLEFVIEDLKMKLANLKADLGELEKLKSKKEKIKLKTLICSTENMIENLKLLKKD